MKTLYSIKREVSKTIKSAVEEDVGFEEFLKCQLSTDAHLKRARADVNKMTDLTAKVAFEPAPETPTSSARLQLIKKQGDTQDDLLGNSIAILLTAAGASMGFVFNRVICEALIRRGHTKWYHFLAAIAAMTALPVACFMFAQSVPKFIDYVIANWILPPKQLETGLLDFTSQSYDDATIKRKSRVIVKQAGSDAPLPPGIVHIRVNYGTRTFRQQGFVTHGFNLLTTAHSFEGITDSFEIEIRHRRRGVDIVSVGSLNASTLTFSDSKDLVTVDISSVDIQPFPDWRRHFTNNPIIPEYFNSTMRTYTEQGFVKEFCARSKAMYKVCMYDSETRDSYNVAQGFRTPISTTDGDCGGVLFNHDVILGMHVGATTDCTTAFAIHLTSDDILGDNVLLPTLKKQSDDHVWMTQDDKIVPIGTLASSEIIHNSGKTKITKSVIHGVFPPTTAPAILTTKDPRNKTGLNPMWKGIQKYQVPTNVLSDELITVGCEALLDIFKVDTGITFGPLTEHQVLNGDPNIPYCAGLDLNTGCGDGWPVTPLGKAAHIERVDDHYEITSPLLRTRLDNLEKSIMDGNIVVQVVADTLKDERRKLAKIDSCDTRVINVYPMEYTILMNKHFGKVMCHFFSMHLLEHPIAVGLDPYSKDWHLKIQYLLEMSDYGFDADGKYFDATFPLRNVVTRFMWQFICVTTKDHNYRRFLFRLFFSGFIAAHKAGSYAFYTEMGVLSGYFFTTFINSFTVYFYLYVSYYRAAPVQLRSHASFIENVRAIIFGDDHVVSVSLIASSFFSYKSVATFLSTLGLTYTPGSKVDNEQRSLWPVLECTFLKNSIGTMGPFYVAQLDPVVWREMVNWTRKSDDNVAATIVNIRMAQRFAFFHGKAVHDEFINKLKDAMPGLVLPAYRDLQDTYKLYGTLGYDEYNPFKRKQTNIDKMNSNLIQDKLVKQFYESHIQPFQVQSSVVDMIQPFAKIIDGIIPRAIQEDALGMLGALDKPTLPDTISKTRWQFVGNWNTGRTIDTSIPFRSDPSTMTLTDEQHFKKGDEMMIANITRIPTAIVTSFDVNGQGISTWTTGNAPGLSLFTELVSPVTEIPTYYPLATTYTGIIPTALAYTAIKFHHWRGSINYELEVFGGPFHKGSLRFSFHPDVYNVADVSSETAKSSQYFTVLNLTDKTKKISLTVPHNHRYPWLEVPNTNTLNTPAKCRRFSPGIVVVSVVKRLIASGQASPSIGFVVRRSAGSDFSLANLDLHNTSVQLAQSEWETVPFTVQSDVNAAQGLNSVAEHDTTVGTTIAVAQIDAIDTNNSPPIPTSTSTDRFRTAITEEKWTLEDSAAKRMLFDVVDWPSTAVHNTILALYDVPNDITVCELNSIPKNRFVNVTTDVEITAELASNAFDTGAVALVFLPLVNKGCLTVGPQTHNTFLSCPTQADFSLHVLMQPATDTTYNLTIPYRHPQASLNLTAGDSLGTLALMVYQQLANITPSNPVTISLHGHLKGAVVSTPRPCTVAEPGVWFNNNTEIERIQAHEYTKIKFRNQSTVTELNPTAPLAQQANSALAKAPNTISFPASHRSKKIYDVQHFEDQSTDLQYLMKAANYSYARTFTTDATLPTSLFFLDIADDILFPSGLGTTEPDNGAGMIGWFGPMYRAFRGDLRLKMIFQLGPSDVQSTASIHGWVTHAQEAYGQTLVGTIQTGVYTNAHLTFPTSTAAPYMTAGTPHGHNFILTDANPEVVEIEIPYSRLVQFTIPSCYGIQNAQDPYGLGTLVIALNDQYGSTNITCRIYAFLGDAARFGIPWMIPPITIVPKQFPDSWDIVPGPHAEATPSDTDSDYIEVVSTDRKKKPQTRVSLRKLKI
jgi:hypothetical protein